jgi:hypothetical protein
MVINRGTFRRVLPIVAAVALLSGAAPTAAQANSPFPPLPTAPPVSTPGQAGANGVVPMVEHLATASALPAGIKPGMPGPDGTVPTIKFVPGPKRSSLATPNSSGNKCVQDVCLSVHGSGTYIGSWDTWAFNLDPGCTFATYINITSNGARVVATSNEICTEDAGVFYSEWDPNRNFPNDSIAANTWQGFPGEPSCLIWTL